MTYQIESLKIASKKTLGESQRLCRVIAKGGKIGAHEIESQGCVLPVLSRNTVDVLFQNPAAAEWLRGKVEEVQDGIVRKAVENGKLCIFDAMIDIQEIVSAMSAVNESVRFSKESIAVWFNEVMKPALAGELGNRNVPAGAVMDKILAQYLGMFQSLSQKGSIVLDGKVKQNLSKALLLLDDDTESMVGNEIARRIGIAIDPSDEGAYNL